MNTTNTLTLDVVTPEAVAVSRQVPMVVIPGMEGDFGVLPGHSPLISAIRPGIIKLYDAQGAVSGRFLVTGGFAEVTPERCTILATEIFDFASTSRKDLEKRLETVKLLHTKAKNEREKLLAETEAEVVEKALGIFISELDSHH